MKHTFLIAFLFCLSSGSGGLQAEPATSYYTEDQVFQSRPYPTRERFFGNIGTGLTAPTQYSYWVHTRDKGPAQTATAWSSAASAITASTVYGTWSGGAAFDADANNNGMAWLLGASGVSENAHGKLPKAPRNGTNLRLAFHCLKSAMRDTTQLKIQFSTDLSITDLWTNHEAAVPDGNATVNGVVFAITEDSKSIQVIADIPANGPKIFSRLSAVKLP